MPITDKNKTNLEIPSLEPYDVNKLGEKAAAIFVLIKHLSQNNDELMDNIINEIQDDTEDDKAVDLNDKEKVRNTLKHLFMRYGLTCYAIFDLGICNKV